ncbi:MAG: YdeI/OmpD-associated family protein [Thermoanaerobaculia bacterium]|jgi:uncharacterized protein YdeI (YjbR/CyaY-like superfamily)|nr:YdeI/OmpD-associated family protein [Thermoanaerobaculia bacterium]MBP9823397.1 YdeI/OmpD-associated family protein [Thermoanaerobaculia bacterium]
MPPSFFPSAVEFRRWLEDNHATATELLVGFRRRDSGRPSLTWPESVDEALCFGWIDGVRRRIDEASYSIRFTPRRAASVWSAVNIAKFGKLEEEGRMTDAGRAAFSRRKENRSGIYAYEQRPQELPREYRAQLDQNPQAARDFDARPAGYRKTAIWKIVSAKQATTRLRRFAELVDCHARGELIPDLRRTPR